MRYQMVDPITLVRENIRSLAPYSTARDEYQGDLGIYLDANENPYDNGYNRYPDPYQRVLKTKLSEIKCVASENIFIGNGSDEAIDLMFRVFCDPGRDNVVSISPTYGMYKVAAATNNVAIREVQLRDDFSLDVDSLLDATNDRTKLIFLCSPNNPTANSFSREEIIRVITDFKGIVVLDEAYIDFSTQAGFLSELDNHSNLVILQTLSKAWGMAGLRLGLAFGRKDIINILTRVKYPYNINCVTQKIVLEQLTHDITPQIEEVISQRQIVLEQMNGFDVILKVYPSDTNFVLVAVERPREVYNILIDSGIIVRDRSHIAGCSGCLRITIGTPQENAKMLNVLRSIDIKIEK